MWTWTWRLRSCHSPNSPLCPHQQHLPAANTRGPRSSSSSSKPHLLHCLALQHGAGGSLGLHFWLVVLKVPQPHRRQQLLLFPLQSKPNPVLLPAQETPHQLPPLLPVQQLHRQVASLPQGGPANELDSMRLASAVLSTPQLLCRPFNTTCQRWMYRPSSECCASQGGKNLPCLHHIDKPRLGPLALECGGLGVVHITGRVHLYSPALQQQQQQVMLRGREGHEPHAGDTVHACQTLAKYDIYCFFPVIYTYYVDCVTVLKVHELYVCI